MENKIEIQVNNGKYGIVDTITGQTIIPFEHDNIFTYNFIKLKSDRPSRLPLFLQLFS